jgi:hypothetical protein
MLVVVVMRVPIEPGEREREREAERQKKRSFGVVHAGSLLGHSKKKTRIEREKQWQRKNLFSLLFFTPGRTTMAMLTEQRVEWKINVSILGKKKEEVVIDEIEKKRKKRNCSHHSNIFAYKQTFIDIFYVYRYIFSYIFPFEINVEKKKKYLPN